MAITVLITLTAAGTDTSLFDLYSDVDSFTTPFETNVTKSALVSGYLSTLVPDSTTIIRVQSLGICGTYDDAPLEVTTTTSTSTTAPPTTTTTSTSTSTTTTLPPTTTTTTTQPPTTTTTSTTTTQTPTTTTTTSTTTTTPPTTTSTTTTIETFFILMEDSGYVLQETNDKIILE